MKHVTAALTVAFVMTACGGNTSGDPAAVGATEQGAASETTPQTKSYSKIGDLIADVENAGYTCWKWQIDDDEVSPSLLGAAGSARCYRDAEEMGVYFSVGRIAIFAATSARDEVVQTGLNNGTAYQFVGANYVVNADKKTQLEKLVGTVEGKIVGNEFDIDEGP